MSSDHDAVLEEVADVVVACADAIGRAGALNFTVGHLDDDVPVHMARWYAQATWQGRRVIIENQQSPAHACDRLVRQILEGGVCNHCLRPITLGRYHPAQCVWRRTGDRWDRTCLDQPDIGPGWERIGKMIRAVPGGPADPAQPPVKGSRRRKPGHRSGKKGKRRG